MSDYDIVNIEKREIQDFINIDHGSEKVRLGMFQNYTNTSIRMTPEQAREVAEVLKKHAQAIDDQQPF